MTARYELEYDDADLGAALTRLVERLRHPKRALDEIGAQLVSSTRLRFVTQSAPDGAPWKPSARARRQGGQTLSDTGRLRRSITARVTPRGLQVGTNVAYAAPHQFGAEIPARTIRARFAQALAFPGRGGRTIFRKSVRHPGSTIPARPFLGLSAEDERDIRRIVGRWLGEAAR